MRLLLILISGLLAASHPRLFLTPETLKAARAAIAKPGHHQEAVRTLRARLERGLEAYTGRTGYQVSAYVRELAFDYQLTGDASRCQQAFSQLQGARSFEDQPDSGYGLSRATMSVGYAFAYDWCHAAWTPDQRREIL
jgi:hypothetical protein